MTLNRILWNYLIAPTVITIAVCGCTTQTPNTQDLIAQSPKDSQLVRTLSARSDSGYSVAYSPSSVGTILASAGAKSIKLWNPNTGKLLRTLSGQAFTVGFSPDGQILASGSQDGSLNLWDVQTGKLIRTLQHSEPVLGVVFSPDGQTLVSNLDLGSIIRLWNWRTGEIIRIKDDPDAYQKGFENFKTQPATFSLDGQTLFATSGSGSLLQSWNLKTSKRTGSFEAKSSINAVAISPDGNTLATGIRDNAIKLWNINDGKLIHTLTGHKGQVRTVAFSPDRTLLASGSSDGTVKLWNATTGKEINTFTAHKEQVWSVAFNPDGKTLASTGQDGSVKIWGVSPQ
ncbi:WD-40 repeat-containing protein (plasmid) [Trichormus variabilis ATCC 29413]|uniref:WD-40 repeat-containing protein n=2 Tax=Anabaena variabilis TaxID=264691 RepID=Q3M2H9_TRIV2|nr:MULTISPECIES: WD40 repeat domain-containing protein [Nostocaceae]ABA24807.1 WD-40 repeat-containing protein [Trichormus variabilis ATCC 29413]MBC1218021.1 WD40 repeat domain-containing protein [Trichormus variabilis ARAD]MBC1259212.1 WD40 repeat domain-containing protein [Trichormus variabilis V5]MBC1270625.1 WD40 repeat domain-containing protein [Trichormus variabilis FSR]MBC1305478.1 WD40 repeat domain-containing protein [Trichormus variabilis N2B]